MNPTMHSLVDRRCPTLQGVPLLLWVVQCNDGGIEDAFGHSRLPSNVFLSSFSSICVGLPH